MIFDLLHPTGARCSTCRTTPAGAPRIPGSERPELAGAVVFHRTRPPMSSPPAEPTAWRASSPSGARPATSQASGHRPGRRSRTSTPRKSSSAAGTPARATGPAASGPCSSAIPPPGPGLRQRCRHRLHPEDATAPRRPAGCPAAAREPVRRRSAARARPRRESGSSRAWSLTSPSPCGCWRAGSAPLPTRDSATTKIPPRSSARPEAPRMTCHKYGIDAPSNV